MNDDGCHQKQSDLLTGSGISTGRGKDQGVNKNMKLSFNVILFYLMMILSIV